LKPFCNRSRMRSKFTTGRCHAPFPVASGDSSHQ
jgi:hypothetical protein